MADGNDRDHLIATAVKFLQNPNVGDTLRSKKRSFLSQKGLTEEEIDKAFEIADHASSPHLPQPPPLPQPYHGYPYPTSYTGSSRWTQLKDTVSFVCIVGGGTYALYKFYQDVIKPLITNKPSRTERDELLSIQHTLRDTLTTVQSTLTTVQSLVTQQQEKIDAIVNSLQLQKSNEDMTKFYGKHAIDEIKSEITSLKSLLLNRHQFPPTSRTTPILPSWQLTKPSDPSDRDTSSSDSDSQSQTVSKAVTSSGGKGTARDNVARSSDNVNKPSGDHFDKPSGDNQKVATTADNLTKSSSGNYKPPSDKPSGDNFDKPSGHLGATDNLTKSCDNDKPPSDKSPGNKPTSDKCARTADKLTSSCNNGTTSTGDKETIASFQNADKTAVIVKIADQMSPTNGSMFPSENGLLVYGTVNDCDIGDVRNDQILSDIVNDNHEVNSM